MRSVALLPVSATRARVGARGADRSTVIAAALVALGLTPAALLWRTAMLPGP